MAADGLPMTWLFEEEGKTNRFGAKRRDQDGRGSGLKRSE
jgi:hypothetical protein